MYPAISLIFTIMELGAHMHSQSEHLFVKINKKDGACVSSLHETISLFKGSVVVPYCYLFLLSVFVLWFSYYVSDIF